MKRFFTPWASRMGRRFSAGCDVKGILWDRVTADRQAAEIRQTYPSTSYRPTNPVRSVLASSARASLYSFR
jgi:hypothetical protein